MGKTHLFTKFDLLLSLGFYIITVFSRFCCGKPCFWKGSAFMKKKTVPALALSYFGSLMAGTGVCLVFFAFFSSFFQSTLGTIVIQAVFLLIYGAFGYSVLWRRGDADSNLCQFGHIEKDLSKGFRVGLLGYLPYLVLDLALLLSKTGLIPNWLWIYKILNTPYIAILNLFLSTGDIANHSYGDVALAIVLHWVVIALAGVAYMIGFHRVSLLEKMVYREKKQNKK